MRRRFPRSVIFEASVDKKNCSIGRTTKLRTDRQPKLQNFLNVDFNVIVILVWENDDSKFSIRRHRKYSR